jgi:hypothetical protein
MKRPDGVTILAIYHYVMAGIVALVSCALVAVPFVVAAAVQAEPDAAPAVPIVAIVIAVAIVILLAIAVGYGVVGWGLWTLKPWARLGAIVLAVLGLLNVPLGTIIGVVTLWYLFQPEGRAAFGETVVQ